eukprot:TRINITY_DN1986_c0_g1_i1.p1 TRINITY_DN1986_c0_g1~~TRINITY_DN1986_c0_g1_i1.p1  ORF type:complete len:162 (-),score=27.27 TRINITY_DN1986_c0_g1_i1:66-515(-)
MIHNKKIVIVVLLAILPSLIFAKQFNVTKPFDTCGGNCPSDDCSGCPCGTDSAYVDIPSVCSQYDGWDQGCCQCIVNAESGGNANAVNENTNGSFDVGVWQINSMNWASCNNGAAPCDVNSNMQCAIAVWQWGGNSFNLWSTCGGCGCC